jgi:hypothetical protein
MNLTRPNQNRPDSNRGLALGAPASRRRADDGLAGGTPALPGNALRFWDASRGLRTVALLAGFVVLGLANSFPAAAQQTNAPAGTNYSSFQIIAERNIFDPNRYPRTSRSNRRTSSRSATTFSLVGTMSYQRGMIAFFDGTDSGYRKVLTQNGVVAGYKVVEITLRGVKLESGGKQIEMKVGAQMRQESKGEWQLAGPGELPASTAENEVTASNETPSSAGSSSEGNDVLKKLMQQREQELK